MNRFKINKSGITIIILYVLLISGCNNIKRVNLSVDDGNLEFKSDGISIQGARPSLSLLIGSEKKDTFEW